MKILDRRKELKLAYKLNPPLMGVYRLRNEINGKVYIGGSMNLPGKENRDRFQLAFGSHTNKELQQDWNRYGSDKFVFDILETINPEKIEQEHWRKTVADLEEKWLTALQPYDEQGYNKKRSM